MAQLGKYNSDRDAVLHTLACEQWADSETGSVESPIGYVWAMTITRDGASQVIDDGLALDQAMVDSDFDPWSIVGAWLITEDDQGFVHVGSYSTSPDGPEMLKSDFDSLASEYDAWCDAEYPDGDGPIG